MEDRSQDFAAPPPPPGLEQTLRELRSRLPAFLQVFAGEIENHARSVAEGMIRRMDLVSREEFLAQQAVLSRTRARLRDLEARIALLERQLGVAQTAETADADARAD